MSAFDPLRTLRVPSVAPEIGHSFSEGYASAVDRQRSIGSKSPIADIARCDTLPVPSGGEYVSDEMVDELPPTCVGREAYRAPVADPESFSTISAHLFWPRGAHSRLWRLDSFNGRLEERCVNGPNTIPWGRNFHQHCRSVRLRSGSTIPVAIPSRQLIVPAAIRSMNNRDRS